MSFNIEVAGGSSVRLPTAGKYCERDIVITATGGGGGFEICAIHVTFSVSEAYHRLVYSTINDNGNPALAILDYDGVWSEELGMYMPPSQKEYDIEVICGSCISIVEGNFCGVSIESDFTRAGIWAGECLFVPAGVTSANITIS